MAQKLGGWGGEAAALSLCIWLPGSACCPGCCWTDARAAGKGMERGSGSRRGGSGGLQGRCQCCQLPRAPLTGVETFPGVGGIGKGSYARSVPSSPAQAAPGSRVLLHEVGAGTGFPPQNAPSDAALCNVHSGAEALPQPLCWLHPLLGVLVLGDLRCRQSWCLWPGNNARLCWQRILSQQPWVPTELSRASVMLREELSSLGCSV